MAVNLKKETKIPVNSTGVITFLDVLGWQGIYARNSNAIKSLKSLIEEIKTKSKYERGFDNIFYDVEIKSISDTIVILTPCKERDAATAINIHGTLCQWIIPYSIKEEIPIRGAISFGEFQNVDNIFLGKAVDEAAAWHEQADWIGVNLTPSAEYLYDVEIKNNLWVKYSLPITKSSVKWESRCVNWTSHWENKDDEIKKIKDKFRQLGPMTPDIAGKFVNTLKFIDEAIKTNKNKLNNTG